MILGIITITSSSLLYLIGGQWWRPARWLIGLPMGAIYALTTHSFIPLLCWVTYFIATSAFPYGMNSWLNFVGEKGKFFICGFVFGLASMPVLHLLSILAGIVSGFGFLVLKVLDDKNLVKNPAIELLRGAVGCVAYIFK